MKNFVTKAFISGFLALALVATAQAQDPPESPFGMNFWDSTYSTTYLGDSVAVGSIIQAYDIDGNYCGLDTVRVKGTFGYMVVTGDDPGSPAVDEGPETGEPVRFKINGRDATVLSGDSTWADKAVKSVVLSASATVAFSVISTPNPADVQPESTATLEVQVRNDGDGLDFYGVDLTLSVDDTVSSPGPFDWEKLEPDSVVYADPGETVSVFFSVRAPRFHDSTSNTVTWTVYSHNDPSVNASGQVVVTFTLSDVEDPYAIGLPGSFALHQNYPNPFNPTTKITYDLTSRSHVLLEVFDLLGRTVDRIDAGLRPAGPGEIDYDASGLASGVYLYRLSTESFSKSRKMILLK